MSLKKDHSFSSLYFIMIFFFLFVFFCKIHPLIPYDGDDWTYLSFMRQAIPLWGAWNPTRIFPECIAPLVGFTATYLIMPITGDYIRAVTIVTSCVVSLLITAYVWLFYRMVCHNLQSQDTSLFITSIFFLFHFLIFKSKPSNNMYMFWTADYSCVFYYLLSALLNSSLVLLLMDKGSLTRIFYELRPIKSGLLSLWLYCAIFSNIFDSVIFIIYLGLNLLIDIKNNFPFQRAKLSSFIKDHHVDLIVLLSWLIVLVFEANGGRSHSIGKSIFLLPYGETAKAAIIMFKSFSGIFIVLSVIILLFSIWQMWKMRQENFQKVRLCLKNFGLLLVCGLLTFIFLFLLCSKSVPGYFSRADVSFGYNFYFILLISVALEYILLNNAKLLRLAPIFIFALMIATINSNQAFKESNTNNVSPDICYKVDCDLMSQIISADQAGANEMTLYVPKAASKNNWPHAMFMGARISQTMYRHGLIQRQIKITVQPDINMNKKYNLPIPK